MPAASGITLGISACLLGEEVRFNGGHKKDRYLLHTLGQYLQFKSVCPEVGAGLGVPRPAIRLVGTPDGAQRVVELAAPHHDHTERLQSYSTNSVAEFSQVSGFILKSKSPSCGWKRVRVYSDEAGHDSQPGQGVFAQALVSAYPHLPIEEEGRLGDPYLRENFLSRVFIYHAWQQLQAEGLSKQALVQFHTEIKFILLAHDEVAYRALGQTIAQLDTQFERVQNEYIGLLMQALQKRATPKRHSNVLMHAFGYLKQHLDADDKQEFLARLDEYRQGYIPLIVPITLLQHYIRKHKISYLQQQRYFNPYPTELMLRNHT